MSAPQPGSDEWSKFVTASKVAGILGVSPFESPMSVWLAMKGRYRKEQTTAMSRGHYLESGILSWFRDQHEITDWREQEWTERDGWMAATPDGIGVIDGEEAVVDAKSTAYDDDWNNDAGGTSIDGVPLYYWVQTQWQMIVTGTRVAYVAVLGPRLKFEQYRVEMDDAEAQRLIAACAAFHESLAADEPPALDGHKATYEAVRKLHQDIDAKTTVDLPESVAVEYVAACLGKDEAEARERKAKATVLDAMGRANYADCNGVRVARRQPNKYGIQINRVAKTTAAITNQKDAA